QKQRKLSHQKSKKLFSFFLLLPPLLHSVVAVAVTAAGVVWVGGKKFQRRKEEWRSRPSWKWEPKKVGGCLLADNRFLRESSTNTTHLSSLGFTRDQNLE